MPCSYNSEPNTQTPYAAENALTQEPANFFSTGSYSPLSALQAFASRHSAAAVRKPVCKEMNTTTL